MSERGGRGLVPMPTPMPMMMIMLLMMAGMAWRQGLGTAQWPDWRW